MKHRKNRKKFNSLLKQGLMLFLAFMVGVSTANVSPMMVRAIEDVSGNDAGDEPFPDEGGNTTVLGPDGEVYHTGVIPVEDENIPSYRSAFPMLLGLDPLVGDGDLPNKYLTSSSDGNLSSIQLPPARDQGSYNSCWAFAATACVEINLIKKGLADSSIDLSELALAYFSYHSVTDPLGGLTGDSHNIKSGYNFLNCGGNYIFASNALMDWAGVQEESLVPYDSTTISQVLQNGLSDATAYENAAAHVTAQGLIVKTDDVSRESYRERIKAAVYEYGAVSTTCYMPYSAVSYYNSETYGWYYPSDVPENHGITIVGWDDTYAKTNFTNTPSVDGAWIVRNSWGESWGDGGYFYMSYDDASIGNSTVFYDAELGTTLDNNYQYDGGYWRNSVGNSSSNRDYSNVFVTKAVDGCGEWLKSVSVDIATKNTPYTVNVYKELTDVSKPDSGELLQSFSGTSGESGSVHLELDNPVFIVEGTYFSVVVSLPARGYLFTDSTYSGSYTHVTFSTVIRPGESFYKADSETTWSDYAASGTGNFLIKAYTENHHALQETLPREATKELDGTLGYWTCDYCHKIYLEKTADHPTTVEERSIKYPQENDKQDDGANESQNPESGDGTGDNAGDNTGDGTGDNTGDNITIPDKPSEEEVVPAEPEPNPEEVKPEVPNPEVDPPIVAPKATTIKKLESCSNGVKISWKKIAGADGYLIYRGGTLIKTIKSVGTTSYVDKKAKTHGKKYTYKIYTYRLDKDGSKKKTASAKKSVYYLKAPVVSVLRDVSLDMGPNELPQYRFQMKWNKLTKVSGYRIYYSTNKSFAKNVKKITLGAGTLKTTVAKLSKGIYYIKICSFKNVGGVRYYSYYSAPMKIKVCNPGIW